VPDRTKESGETDREGAGVGTRPGAELDIGDLADDDGWTARIAAASVTRVTTEA
jgi:hypothetical protein